MLQLKILNNYVGYFSKLNKHFKIKSVGNHIILFRDVFIISIIYLRHNITYWHKFTSMEYLRENVKVVQGKSKTLQCSFIFVNTNIINTNC